MFGRGAAIISKYRGAAIVVSVFLVLWEITARTHHKVLGYIWEVFGFSKPVPDWKFLSSPLEVVQSMPDELSSGSLASACWQTLSHTLVAFIISWTFGLLLSQVLASSGRWRRALLPIINGLSGVPPVTLFPLLLVAFKLGGGSVIALAVFGAIVSVTLICYETQSRITSEFRLTISKLGYSRIGAWLWELSTASNGLYTAAREGVRWSLILSVVGEMHGSVAGGLGAYVDSGRLNQNYAIVYVGILACAILSLLLKVALDLAAAVLHKIVKRFLLSIPNTFHTA